MKVAKRIRDLEDFTGSATLYKLDPPMKGGIEFVIVSATTAMFSGAETYIFSADIKGEIVDWSELYGSYRGGLSHVEALKGAGYSIN